MPRQPDPELEQRVLNAAHALLRRGGEQALTMRAVARAAGSNTPAVYRRFKDRRDLIQGMLQRTVERLGEIFDSADSLEEMAEMYVEMALREPEEFELFYKHGNEFLTRRHRGKPQTIREIRPNFGRLEGQLAKRLGGEVDDHTRLALAIWAILHGTTSLLLSKSIPQGHEPQLRQACRDAIQALLAGSANFSVAPARRR